MIFYLPRKDLNLPKGKFKQQDHLKLILTQIQLLHLIIKKAK